MRDNRTGRNIADGFGGKNATRALTWTQIRDDGIFYRCYIRVDGAQADNRGWYRGGGPVQGRPVDHG
eukprot:3659966-Alexandrium_andersonii.AAC.1